MPEAEGGTRNGAEPGNKGPCAFCKKQLLKIPEACQYLGISVSKGYEMVHAGEFPVSVRRVGSQWRVSRAEMDEWLRTPQRSGDAGLRVVGEGR